MNKLQTEAMDRNTECAPMAPEFRVLPDLDGAAVRALPSDLTEREQIDLLCHVETYMSITDKHSQTAPEAMAEETRMYSLVNGLIAKRFSNIGAAVRGEAVALTDDQIGNFWMNRDCMDAIRAGDVVAQFVSAFRAGMKALGVSARVADAPSDLRQALIDVRHAIQFSHDSVGGIDNMPVMMHQSGTVVEFIDGVLSGAAADAPSEPSEPQAIQQLRKSLAGWMEEAAAQRRSCEIARTELDLRRLHQKNDVWFWQGDGTDYPESISNSMCVVMRGDHLRALVDAGKSRAADALDSQPTAPMINYVRSEWESMCRKAVAVLNKHIVPDGISDHDALNELYGIFDSDEYRSTGAIEQDACEARQAVQMKIDRSFASSQPTDGGVRND